MTTLAKRLIEAGARAECTALANHVSGADPDLRRHIVVTKIHRIKSKASFLAALRALQNAGPSEGMVMQGCNRIPDHVSAVSPTAIFNAMLSALISDIEATDVR